MWFVVDRKKPKEESGYRTIYLRQWMIDAIQEIAREQRCSFNAVVVSMIEYCVRNGEKG